MNDGLPDLLHLRTRVGRPRDSRAALSRSWHPDEKTFHGGNYARPHPEFYHNTSLKETRAPEHGDFDVIESVLPRAKQRGMRLICSCEDALDGVKGKCLIYPGIDIGIPTGGDSRKASPEDTYAATMAALKAGAWLILSRKYSEMKLANLSAAGRAVREFRKAG